MMEFIKQPMAIEHRSMELIAPYLAGLSLSEAEKKVYSRIIHAAGDVEYAPIIRISETAVAAGIAALRGGADIYTDVEMVRTGINKRKLASFGGTVHCRIADPEIAARAKTQGVTRSLMAMRSFGQRSRAASSPSAMRRRRSLRSCGSSARKACGRPASSASPSASSARPTPRRSWLRMASSRTSRSRARKAAVRLPPLPSMRCSTRLTTAATEILVQIAAFRYSDM